MATARAGVLTAVDVQGPMDTGNGGNGNSVSLSDLFHPKSGATWALIWWLVAVLLLFVV